MTDAGNPKFSLIFGYLLLCLVPGPAEAQQVSWEQDYGSGITARAQGRFADEKELLERALSKGNLDLRDMRRADIDDLLASVCQLLGEPEKAERLFLEADRIVEGPHSANPELEFLVLADLGAYRARQGRLQDAEHLLNRAMEKGKGSQASEANIASVKASLAQVYMIEGRLSDAQPLLEQAVKVHQAALPATAVDRLFSESGLGTLYAWEGRFAMSHALLDAVSQAASQLGELHPIYAESLVSLADVYRMEGDVSRREPLLRKALYIYEKSLGPDSPRVADTLLDISLDSLSEGKPAMAEAVLGRALAILRRAFGPDHTMVAVGEYRLAEAYIQLKKTAEAKLLLDHALRVEQATYPDGHTAIADCFFALARLEAMQHHDGEAEQYCRTAIAMYEKSAPTSTGLRAALRQYAKLVRTHDSAEAKVLVTRAKELDQMAKTLK